jgi:hypothetical protein
MVSKKDLDRGYSDTGDIPDIGANVHKPVEKTNWMKEYATEGVEDFGGFLGRDDCGYERI